MRKVGIIFILFLMLLIKTVECRNIEYNMTTNEVWVDDKLDKNAGILLLFDSPLNNITPEYQVLALMDKTTLDAGEDFTISFQISGNGKIISNKFMAFFPDQLIEDNPSYYWYIAEYLDEDTGEPFGLLWLDKYPFSMTCDKYGAITSLPEIAFMHSKPDSPVVFTETCINHRRPIGINATTCRDAAAGDHIIIVQFDYSDGDKWYTSQDKIVIHIRDWYEKIENQIGVAFLVGIGLFFIDYGSRRLNSKKNGFECPINQQSPKHKPKKKNRKKSN